MRYITIELYSYSGEPARRRSREIDDADSMRAFCENALKSYGIDDIDVTGMSLEELITYTLKHGRNRFDEMEGWGLNYVVRLDQVWMFEAED